MSTQKGNQKHLTLSDRINIEKGLNNSDSFAAIAREIHQDPQMDAHVKKYIYGNAPLWQPSYFVATTGTTVMEKVREYIDSQQTEEHRRKYEKTGRYSKKRRR